jgi:uncharacterized RDD family membrane protein YckC
MDQILDIPVDNEQRKLEYAGFWIRFAAYFIDAILLWVVNFIVALIFVGGYNIYESNISLRVFSFVIGVLYFVVMESSDRQATLGKLAVGVKVGDKNGNKISFANALGRYFAKLISAIILLIGFMMAGWDDRKQALHDKIADTFVFYSK